MVNDNTKKLKEPLKMLFKNLSSSYSDLDLSITDVKGVRISREVVSLMNLKRNSTLSLKDMAIE
jgi:hypothetical protein